MSENEEHKHHDDEAALPEGVVVDPISPDADDLTEGAERSWRASTATDEEAFDPDTGEVLNDRGISSVGGNPAANKNTKAIAVAAFIAVLGGAATMIIMDDGKKPKAETTVMGPVRQSVPFEAAAGPPPPPPSIGDPEAEAAILAGDVPVASSSREQDREPEVDPRIKRMEDARRAPISAFGGGGSLGGGMRGRTTDDGREGGNNGQQAGLVTSMFGPTEPNELEKMRQGSAIGRAQARTLTNRNFLMTAGTQVPCVLQTAMDTATPGYVSCLIGRNVYSDNGNTVLMEKGTRVLGEYRGRLQRGQNRMFVLWNRAVTPQGVSIDLASPAADTLGRAGMSGQVETFFWERFGGSMLVSVVDDAVAIASRQNEDARNTVRQSSDAATVALENSINIPPVLRKRQGEEVVIFTAQDLDFSRVYSLRLR